MIVWPGTMAEIEIFVQKLRLTFCILKYLEVLVILVMQVNLLITIKFVSSSPVYYSILNSFGQRSQYISIKFPLHKQSENPLMCY